MGFVSHPTERITLHNFGGNDDGVSVVASDIRKERLY